MFAGPVSWVTENMRFMWGQSQHQRQRLLRFRRYFRTMHTHANARRPLCGHNTNSWGHIALHWTYDVLCLHEMPWLWRLCFPCSSLDSIKTSSLKLTILWYGVYESHKTYLYSYTEVMHYGSDWLWCRSACTSWLENCHISYTAAWFHCDRANCRIQSNVVYRKQLERLSRHAENPIHLSLLTDW